MRFKICHNLSKAVFCVKIIKMHDIWNPWHGCKKCSEGCQNCYMYHMDAKHGNFDSETVRKTNMMNYPLLRDKNGSYRIKSGESVRICMTSDFFVEEADKWRGEAFEVIASRLDVKFFILTKRPERVEKLLPQWWGDGLENVLFNVTCENQKRTDERIPIMFGLPFKHKGIMTAPLLEEITIEKYLQKGIIEQVVCGGENYNGARECNYDWVKRLSDECKSQNVTFAFIETGNNYVKNGERFFGESKQQQAKRAYFERLEVVGKKPEYYYSDGFGLPLKDDELYKPHYRRICLTCGSRLICNGCSDCGKCTDEIVSEKEVKAFDERAKL